MENNDTKEILKATIVFWPNITELHWIGLRKRDARWNFAEIEPDHEKRRLEKLWEGCWRGCLDEILRICYIFPELIFHFKANILHVHNSLNDSRWKLCRSFVEQWLKWFVRRNNGESWCPKEVHTKSILAHFTHNASFSVWLYLFSVSVSVVLIKCTGCQPLIDCGKRPADKTSL